jgi:antitoxin component YwqK of YwqJK toxin-antitoxin module
MRTFFVLPVALAFYFIFPSHARAGCEGAEGPELAACQKAAEVNILGYSIQEEGYSAEKIELVCNGKTVSATRGELENKKKGATLAEFTGVCEIWGESGQCKGENHEIACQSGKVQGTVRVFYPNGARQFEGEFAADSVVEWTAWNEDGSPDSSIKYYSSDHFVGCQFKAGKLTDRWEYRGENPAGYWLEAQPDGSSKEMYYKDGKQLPEIPKEGATKSCLDE